MNNQTDVGIRFTNSVTGAKKVKEYAESLATIKSILSGIDAGTMKQVESSSESLVKETKDLNKTVKTAFNYTMVREFARALSRTFQEMSRLVTKSSEYIENINLFQVAFDGNYQSAEKFVNKLTEMYGLDESWLTRTVGIFKQLSNAMELSTEQGTKLSTLLTQMSLDISSLYNVDIERASSTLQSALAGQTKPIRGVTGADITQNTLQKTLNDIGIDRYIADLSYAEKRLLIVISLTRQLEEATNDMGKTIESPANQMRILSEQWERLSRAVGNLFMPILAKVLPFLNAIMMVLTEIINTIAVLLGFNIDKYNYISGISDSALELEESLGGAVENTKKLKQGLRGFDKLNVITTPSSSSASSGGGAGGIDPAIMDAFNDAFDKYNEKLTNVQMKATKIRDAIMEWLGFTKLVNEETGDISFKFERITSGTVLGALAVGGGIYTGVKFIYSFLKRIGLINFSGMTKLFSSKSGLMAFITSNPKLLLILGAITAIAIAFKKLYDTSEDFRKVVNDFVSSLKEVIRPYLKEVKNIVVPFLKQSWDVLKKLYFDVIKPLGKLLLDILEPVLVLILNTIRDLFVNVIKPLSPYLLDAIEFILPLLAKGIENIVTSLSWLIKNILTPLINKIMPIIMDYIQKTGQKIEWVMDNVLKPLWNNILEPFLTWLWEKLSYLWDNILTPLFNFIVKKINENVVPAINSIKTVVDKIKNAIQKIVDWWNNLSFNKKNIKVEYETKGSGGSDSYGGGGGGGRANGGLFVNGKWQPITNYALGGLPPVGQMFVAREAGPELVGKIGSHTAVMNNDQIVDSVSDGVYKAISSANKNYKSGNEIFNIYLDDSHKLGTYTLNQLKDMAKSNGKPITIG